MVDKKVAIAAIVAVIAICAAVVIINPFSNDSEDVSFVIIHTNDSHCYFSGNEQVGFSTVSELKKQYSEKTTVFTVDAGDFLQGNSYGTLTKGEAATKVMNTVGYDLIVPGNHDFDFGFDIFMEKVGELNFPTICANLVYKDTGESIFKEYLVIERNGIKIGFFGLITPQTETTTMKGNMGNSTVTDPIEASEQMVSLLKKENVDYIVAVGHLGVNRTGFITSDQLCNKVPGIDIFIDGHSHTEMEDGKVCDGSVTLEESDTLIASTGCYTKTVGLITCTSKGLTAKLYRGPTLADNSTDAVVAEVEDEIDRILQTVIGKTEILLDGERSNVRNNETNLGDLITDAMLAATDSTVAIINSGGIRTSIQQGDVTIQSVYDVLPFVNITCVLEVTGSTLWDEMNFSMDMKGTTNGGYLQFSGMTVTYDPNGQTGQKVTSIKIDGKEVDKDAKYKLVTIDFLTTGGDGNTYLVGYEKEMNAELITIVIDYIKGIGTITDSTIEGDRLVSV